MYLAIDIGATKTLIALFSEHGRCLKRSKFLTNQDENLFLVELKSNLEQFPSSKIQSVVVGVPAIVKKNCSISPKNLHWQNFDLLSPLKKIFSCKIFIINDADLATLYESSHFSGISIYLTFSTGIGGGIAKNGSILKESASFEPGHKEYHFGEKDIEWEKLASAKHLKQLFNDKNIDKITKSSDLDTIAYRLSIGLTDIIQIYHPDHIIIGGPVGLIFKKIRPYLKNYLSSSLDKSKIPLITPAKRPAESVIYGCYLYAKFHE